ncbi:MAG: hypothetical protein U1F57_03505 [bacterium]
MRTEILSQEENYATLLKPLFLKDLAEQARQGNESAFYQLLEKAFDEETGALKAFHEVVSTHPSHFSRLIQLLSHPQFFEVALKILENPSFDLSFLAPWVETEPAFLSVLSGLAFEKHHPLALRMLPRLKFDASVYQKTVEKDYAFAVFLGLLAGEGYDNVQELLANLVRGASQEVFFVFMGMAAEGSEAALNALNEGITLAHLTALVDFLRRYENHTEIVGPLLRVIRHGAFCPAELCNPFTQEVLKKIGIESVLFEKEWDHVCEKEEKDFVDEINESWNRLSPSQQLNYQHAASAHHPIPLSFIEEKLDEILRAPQMRPLQAVNQF